MLWSHYNNKWQENSAFFEFPLSNVFWKLCHWSCNTNSTSFESTLQVLCGLSQASGMILRDYLWSSHEGLTIIISDTQFGFFLVSVMKHIPRCWHWSYNTNWNSLFEHFESLVWTFSGIINKDFTNQPYFCQP